MTQAYYTEEEDGEDENKPFTSSAPPTRLMHASEPSSEDAVQLDTDLPPGWQAYYNAIMQNKRSSISIRLQTTGNIVLKT
jgi:hypothetical protein